MSESAPNPRPPVMLGCVVAVAGLAALVLAGALLIVFLESGSDTGKVTLEHIGVYAPGTVTRIADRGFYVVALPDGEVLALSDLDAANRAATGRRCRVAPIAAADPALAAALEAYEDELSPAAEGTTLIFREECNGALYDAAGVRLDADGPNLDRFEVSINDDERLVVHTARRTCTRRAEVAVAEVTPCGQSDR